MISELQGSRDAVARAGYETSDEYNILGGGLLLGRPGSADSHVANATWVLYESGQVVLRRSPRSEDAMAAALHHLASVRSATTESDVTLRLRTILTPAGGALLVDPDVIADTAGFDRRLLSRGYVVLPTTIARVNTKGELLPTPTPGEQPGASAGNVPIERVMLADDTTNVIGDAKTLMAMAAVAVRFRETSLSILLPAIGDAVTTLDSRISILRHQDLRAEIHSLGRRP